MNYTLGNTQNAFFIESFMDELADHIGQDPFELRRKLLANEPRMLATLELAAEKANWAALFQRVMHKVSRSTIASTHRGVM